MSETLLGRVVRIQVQRSILAVKGVGYDPGPLLQVEEAAVGPLGITGLHDGAHVMNVHHAAHPSGRGGGNRTLSIGFTGHYSLMAERFGEVPLGVGGENLIVEHPGRLYRSDLEGTVVMLGAGGEVAVGGARVASPCLEFTSWLLRRDLVTDRSEVEDEMAFLGEGMRGFILDTGGLERPLPVRVGDRVVVRR